MSIPAAELLGIAGLLPIHPRTYMTAWRNREKAAAAAAAEQENPTTGGSDEGKTN